MRFVKPLDKELLNDIFLRFNKIITIEDNTVIGGFGSAVAEFAENLGYKNDLLIHGIPDRFIEHGKPEELYKEIMIDAEGISETVKNFLFQSIKTKINS